LGNQGWDPECRNPRGENKIDEEAQILRQSVKTGEMAGTMADLFNLVMLILASLGAMAFGILAAYGILRTGFALMRPQSRPMAVKVRPEVARIS
jgi:hypothetical protein